MTDDVVFSKIDRQGAMHRADFKWRFFALSLTIRSKHIFLDKPPK